MLRSLLPAFAWLIVIVVLSTRGGVPMPSFNLIGPDKLGTQPLTAFWGG